MIRGSPDRQTSRYLTRTSGSGLTYPEQGSTRTVLPPGYRHVLVRREIGRGPARFREAVEQLVTWGMHERAGVDVVTLHPRVVPGAEAVLGIGVRPFVLRAPVRVVYVVDESDVQGFAYGTLPGHPESGEERFEVSIDPDGAVHVAVRAFSRPASLLVRAAGPVVRRVQDAITERYVASFA